MHRRPNEPTEESEVAEVSKSPNKPSRESEVAEVSKCLKAAMMTDQAEQTEKR